MFRWSKPNLKFCDNILYIWLFPDFKINIKEIIKAPALMNLTVTYKPNYELFNSVSVYKKRCQINYIFSSNPENSGLRKIQLTHPSVDLSATFGSIFLWGLLTTYNHDQEKQLLTCTYSLASHNWFSFLRSMLAFVSFNVLLVANTERVLCTSLGLSRRVNTRLVWKGTERTCIGNLKQEITDEKFKEFSATYFEGPVICRNYRISS